MSDAEQDDYTLWKVDTFGPCPAPGYPNPFRDGLSLDGLWEARMDSGDTGMADEGYLASAWLRAGISRTAC